MIFDLKISIFRSFLAQLIEWSNRQAGQTDHFFNRQLKEQKSAQVNIFGLLITLYQALIPLG